MCQILARDSLQRNPPSNIGFYSRVLEPFFLRSAHRFFIISDNRFLPARVRWSPFFLLRVTRLGTALVLVADFGDWPSSTAIALLSRSLSLLSSATILPVSKMLSSGSLSV
jgi:hypothetical protein